MTKRIRTRGLIKKEFEAIAVDPFSNQLADIFELFLTNVDGVTVFRSCRLVSKYWNNTIGMSNKF